MWCTLSLVHQITLKVRYKQQGYKFIGLFELVLLIHDHVKAHFLIKDVSNLSIHINFEPILAVKIHRNSSDLNSFKLDGLIPRNTLKTPLYC